MFSIYLFMKKIIIFIFNVFILSSCIIKKNTECIEKIIGKFSIFYLGNYEMDLLKGKDSSEIKIYSLQKNKDTIFHNFYIERSKNKRYREKLVIQFDKSRLEDVYFKIGNSPLDFFHIKYKDMREDYCPNYFVIDSIFYNKCYIKKIYDTYILLNAKDNGF